MSPELEPFRALPLRERLFVRGRLASAPLALMAERVPSGRVLDIGCGHGALVSLLAVGDPKRRVMGVDPDPRKIAWARASVGQLPNVELREGTVQSLPADLNGTFDAVVIADVLYLLPVSEWPSFLLEVRRLLAPGGTLLLKEAEADRSWRHLKCVAQEALMVRLLRRTKSSGSLGFQPREATERILHDAGFTDVRVTSLARGYTTPHVLFEAKSRP